MTWYVLRVRTTTTNYPATWPENVEMFSHFGTSEMYLLFQVPPVYDEFVLYQSTIVIQAQNSSASPTSSSSRTSCSVMQQPINHNRWRAVLLSIFLNLHVCSHLSHSLKRLVIVLRPPQMCVCALHSLPILAIVCSETQSVSSENRTTNRVDMELCERVPAQVWQRRGFLVRARHFAERRQRVGGGWVGGKVVCTLFTRAQYLCICINIAMSSTRRLVVV